MQTIRRILEKERQNCDCPKCAAAFPNTNADCAPLPLDDFRARPAARRQDYRVQQSCYHCLRGYHNQRDHRHLDRLDAKVLLDKILGLL